MPQGLRRQNNWEPLSLLGLRPLHYLQTSCTVFASDYPVCIPKNTSSSTRFANHSANTLLRSKMSANKANMNRSHLAQIPCIWYSPQNMAPVLSAIESAVLLKLWSSHLQPVRRVKYQAERAYLKKLFGLITTPSIIFAERDRGVADSGHKTHNNLKLSQINHLT